MGLSGLPLCSLEIILQYLGIECFTLNLFQPYLDIIRMDIASYNALVRLPDNIKYLTFKFDFNQNINKKSLPEQLIYLDLGKYFDREVCIHTFPTGLKTLIFGTGFRHVIQPNVLPKTLKKLTFKFGPLNQLVLTDYHDLTHLAFGYHSHHPYNVKSCLFDKLPHNLKYLKTGARFNHKFTQDYLPNKLTHLVLSNDFNQIIDKDVLPKTLTHLTLGNNYSEIIDVGVLPKSLTHLTFGAFYNKNVKPKSLHQGLTHLTFGHDFNKKLDQTQLPDTIVQLKFGKSFQIHNLQYYPKNLLELSFKTCLKKEHCIQLRHCNHHMIYTTWRKNIKIHFGHCFYEKL